MFTQGHTLSKGYNFYASENIADFVAPQNVVMNLNCNGTNGSQVFTDSSLRSNVMTIETSSGAGAPSISTAQSKFGGGSLLFATGDNIRTPIQSFLAPAANVDWCLEAYVYTSRSFVDQSGGIGYAAMFHFSNSTTSAAWPGNNFLAVYMQGSTGGISVERNNGAGASGTAYVGSVTANTWTHVAVSYVTSTSTTGTFRIFVDGALAVDTGVVTYNPPAGNAYLFIGSIAGNSNASPKYRYQGYMDRIRYTRGNARYTSAFTPD